MTQTKDAVAGEGDNAPTPPLITKYKVRPLVHAELGDTEARCVQAKPRSVRDTALEPLWGAELFSMAEIELTDGTSKYAFVFRRERPFIPHGTDPKKVNDECSRLFAVIPRERTRAIAEGMVSESETANGVVYGDFTDGEWFDVLEIMP